MGPSVALAAPSVDSFSPLWAMVEVCAQGSARNCGAVALSWVYTNLALELERQEHALCPSDHGLGPEVGRPTITALLQVVGLGALPGEAGRNSLKAFDAFRWRSSTLGPNKNVFIHHLSLSNFPHVSASLVRVHLLSL